MTLLTNIYNEEYLLPFWLKHHKAMFDNLIVVDYHSTDNSINICKQYWPDAIIRTTKNKDFDATNIDKEFMELEDSVDGIKIVLNTTEFLIPNKPLKELFVDRTDTISLAITAVSPYSKQTFLPKTNEELFTNLLSKDLVFHHDRGVRQLHTYSNGAYEPGRHVTKNNSVPTNDAHIVWLGYYPMNEQLLKRKLQIGPRVSAQDRYRGWGDQHNFTKEKMLGINEKKSSTGIPLKELNQELYTLLEEKYCSIVEKKTFIVTGGCGFIGSHMTDKLISLGHKVIVIDNLLSGNLENLNKEAIFENVDITDYEQINMICNKYKDIYGIFHFAAIARTPWCIDDPVLCYKTNVQGTINILESARQNNIKRVVLSSSNVVYAFMTPYRTSKEALEGLATAYTKMYNMSVIALRYSNVYGKRQSETGPSPNVFAALRKSKKDCGKLILTGDGTQTRNYTHVSDIVEGNYLAMFNDYCGVIDLCTGVSVQLNEAAKYFNCPIEYIEDRPGDVKHIIQSPDEAMRILGWKAKVQLEEGIKDVL
jgi:UDP-glucose 4-epimerase